MNDQPTSNGSPKPDAARRVTLPQPRSRAGVPHVVPHTPATEMPSAPGAVSAAAPPGNQPLRLPPRHAFPKKKRKKWIWSSVAVVVCIKLVCLVWGIWARSQTDRVSVDDRGVMGITALLGVLGSGGQNGDAKAALAAAEHFQRADSGFIFAAGYHWWQFCSTVEDHPAIAPEFAAANYGYEPPPEKEEKSEPQKSRARKSNTMDDKDFALDETDQSVPPPSRSGTKPEITGGKTASAKTDAAPPAEKSAESAKTEAVPQK